MYKLEIVNYRLGGRSSELFFNNFNEALEEFHNRLKQYNINPFDEELYIFIVGGEIEGCAYLEPLSDFAEWGFCLERQ